MKLSLSKLSPKRLFSSSKPRNSVSKSYSIGATSSTSSTSDTKPTTPTSVLPGLEVVLTRLGGSAEMVREVDIEGAMMSLESLKAEESEMKEAFEFFDTDGDGKITAEELLDVFKGLGDETCSLEDCTRMVQGVDKTGDGFVSFQDFSLMMMVEHHQLRS